MKEIILPLSIIINMVSYSSYIIAIFRGKAKPHRTTRFVLLTLSALATLSLLAQHNSVAVWLAGANLTFSSVLFLLSFKYGMGGWSKMDILCLVIAVVGIIIWQVTGSSTLALYAAILADFTGMVPTIIKSYYHPKTEVWYFFFLAGIGAALNLLATRVWTFQEYAFPLYITLINTGMVTLFFRHKLLKNLK